MAPCRRVALQEPVQQKPFPFAFGGGFATAPTAPAAAMQQWQQQQQQQQQQQRLQQQPTGPHLNQQHLDSCAAVHAGNHMPRSVGAIDTQSWTTVPLIEEATAGNVNDVDELLSEPTTLLEGHLPYTISDATPDAGAGPPAATDQLGTTRKAGIFEAVAKDLADERR